jgi:hypothetical protein
MIGPAKSGHATSARISEVPHDAADHQHALTFWVALVPILLTLIPSFKLPRKARWLAEGEQAPAPMIVH